MCGIAGLSISNQDHGHVDVTAATRAMLLAIEHRGRDATGVAWRAEDRECWVQKDNRPAREFVRHVDVAAARTVIAHTRWATHGDPADNHNNHPIDVGGTVGVHNGVLYNHDGVMEMLGVEMIGEVDSQAIFHLIEHGPKLWDGARAIDLLPLAEGSLAAAWLRPEGERNNLFLARGAGSPLWVATVGRGSFMFASTENAVKAGAQAIRAKVKWCRPTPEGTWMRVRDGMLAATATWKPESGRKVYVPRHDLTSRWEFPTATVAAAEEVDELTVRRRRRGVA